MEYLPNIINNGNSEYSQCNDLEANFKMWLRDRNPSFFQRLGASRDTDDFFTAERALWVGKRACISRQRIEITAACVRTLVEMRERCFQLPLVHNYPTWPYSLGYLYNIIPFSFQPNLPNIQPNIVSLHIFVNLKDFTNPWYYALICK